MEIWLKVRPELETTIIYVFFTAHMKKKIRDVHNKPHSLKSDPTCALKTCDVIYQQKKKELDPKVRSNSEFDQEETQNANSHMSLIGN